jgi:hypothetical protein
MATLYEHNGNREEKPYVQADGMTVLPGILSYPAVRLSAPQTTIRNR